MTVLSGSTGSAGDQSLSDLIKRVRDAAGDTPFYDELGAALNSSDAAFTLNDGSEVQEQAILSIGLETIRVISKGATVTDVSDSARGWRGSTADSHPNGAEIAVNPRYTAHAIQKALNKTLGAIGIAFGKPTWDESQTFSASEPFIQAPAAAEDVWMVAYKQDDTNRLVPLQFTFHRSMPTSIVTSGKAVEMLSAFRSSGTVYIGYDADWTQLANTDDTLDAAYPDGALDLVIDGARAYLADDDLFERMAFGATHAQRSPHTSETGEVRLAARELITRFITRRSEVASRYRHDRLSWIVG